MRARTLSLGLLLATAVLASCADDSLPDPTLLNKIDTLTIYALRGTPIGTSSGFRVTGGSLVRTDGSGSFDFLYDLDSIHGPTFYPAEVTGIIPHSDANPGILPVATPFDSLLSAPSNGYIVDEPVPVDSGDVLLLRSTINCGIGVPFYGKLEVQSIDSVAKTLTFRVLVNNNCGYRDLNVGLPDN